MAEARHPSTACTTAPAITDDVLTAEECRELVFMHGAYAVAGYRPQVTSLTLHDLTYCAPELLLPYVRARQKVWQTVEAAMGMEFGLYPEFTALIAWTAGSNLDWHTDDSRDYLNKRHVSAVLYLSEAGRDFTGGELTFKQPDLSVKARPGRVVCFPASTLHSVSAVTAGRRYTLTMWFTRDADACEDAKVLPRLADVLSHPAPGLPGTMYLTSEGIDVRQVLIDSLTCSSGHSSTADAFKVPEWVTSATSTSEACLRASFWHWHKDRYVAADTGWQASYESYVASMRTQTEIAVQAWRRLGVLLIENADED